MAWLLSDGTPVASLEVAATFRAKLKGLLVRDRFEGALLITKASSVHTIGMRFAIDVAYCDKNLLVLETTTMAPNRVGRPRFGATSVVEANAGAFERWKVVKGSRLEVRP